MGRPSLYGKPMTPAERKAAQVARRLMLLESARMHIRDALAELPDDGGDNDSVRDLLNRALEDLADIK